MKIFSSSKKSKGKRTLNNNGTTGSKASPGSAPPAIIQNGHGKRRMSTKKKVIIIVACIVGFMFLFAGSTLAVVRWQIDPFYSYFFKPTADELYVLPAIAGTPRPQTDNSEPGSDVINDDDDDYVQEDDLPPPVTRDEDHINFLLLGIDEHGNTDVIMLASFNITESTLDIASIPRDTLVNVEWNLKKVNSINAHMRNKYRRESESVRNDKIMKGTRELFRDMLGFEPDYAISVTFGGFTRLIDNLGGVPFNVPGRVNVDGVTVNAGNQTLTGRQALTVMRSRNTYTNHAIGRDFAQQQFMAAVARTLFSTRWGPDKIAEMVRNFNSNVRTDIPLTRLVHFAREFMKLSSDDISFHMMPGEIDAIRGNSYITILVPEWLEVLNKHFNPWSRDIVYEDFSILTRGADRRLMVTDGNWRGEAGWGGNGTGPRNPSKTTDETRPVVGRTPPEHLPEADPGGDRNPVTGGTGGGEDDSGSSGDDGGGSGSDADNGTGGEGDTGGTG